MSDLDQLARRLLRKAVADSRTGCWLWQGAVNHGGYGILWVRTRQRRRLNRVHRLALYLWAGRPLGGQAIVRWRCGNRRCFRPEHLVWHARRSVAERGRAKAAGEHNGRAKLTEAEARLLL